MTPALAPAPWPGGSGELATLIRTHDWSATPLGPLSSWSQDLRTAVDMVLRSPVPMVMLWGPAGIMIYNDAYSIFAGGRHPTLLGAEVLQGWPEVADFNRRVMTVGMGGGTLEFHDQHLVLNRHGTPEEVWLDLYYSPIPGATGSNEGVLAIVIETTQRVLAERSRLMAEEALRRSEERLMLALDAAGSVGAWDWDIPNDKIHANAQFARLFSLAPEQAAAGAPLSAFTAAMHPDDRDWVGAKIMQAVAKAGDFAEEYRLLQEDGSVRWVFARGRAYHGPDGAPLRFPGVAVDITERKDTEQALRESEDRFRAAFAEAPVGMVLLAPTGEFVEANHAFLHMVGRSMDELNGGDSAPITHPDDRELTRRFFTDLRHGLTPIRTIEKRYLHRDGRVVWARASGTVRRDACGRPTQIISIVEDITERKRVEEELRQTQEAAVASSRAKSAFLANMSHELRTPLNAIIGYSEMLQEEVADLGAQSMTTDLQRIHSAGKHLLGLINDLLDLSKIEAGKMDLYVEGFDVAALLSQVMDTLQPLAQRNGNQLTLRGGDDLGRMQTDMTKVRQCLFNLLANACKFTDHGTVTLEAERAGADWLRFRIRDTGIGMSADKIDRLFEVFSQGDAATARNYGGTGLGLALTRRLCRMLGGEVHVQSEEGKGSTFTIELPARVPTAAELPAAAETDGATSQDPDAILVIDDDATARDLIRRALVKEGFRVVTAASGLEGLRLARELRPRAITLDVMMPAMDGWQVLGQLKADPALRDIPVVMVTIVADRNLAFSLGASEYLTKPVDREHLVAELRRALKGR